MNLQRHYTPLTIGTFVVTAITGVLIFFEIAPGSIRATHEWSSMVFMLAGAFHAWSHKKSFFRYFRNGHRYVVCAGVLLGVLLFGASFNDIYSGDAAFERMTNARLQDLAPVLDLETGDLLAELSRRGMTQVHAGLSLNEVAELNGVDVYDVVEPLWVMDSR